MAVSFIFLLRSILFYEYTTFIHCFDQGHLDFSSLGYDNSAAMNFLVHVFCDICVWISLLDNVSALSKMMAPVYTLISSI